MTRGMRMERFVAAEYGVDFEPTGPRAHGIWCQWTDDWFFDCSAFTSEEATLLARELNARQEAFDSPCSQMLATASHASKWEGQSCPICGSPTPKQDMRGPRGICPDCDKGE